MSYRHVTTLDHPLDEVFAWHGRPGALARLLPPWQPVKLIAEASSLRDGHAVLGMPGGLRWQAYHDPAGYEPGCRFTDRLCSPVLDRLISWRHTHSFSEEPGGGTRITDDVDTTVPGRYLEATFAYRARQLRGDLAVHARWSRGRSPLTVGVTGSSGLVGTALCALLGTGGHRVVRLVRSHPQGSDRLWRPESPDDGLLEGLDAVVHLAGAPLAGPFTSSHKRAVRDSRVGPTARLAEAAGRTGVATFVSASAIGYYGPDRGDEVLDESSAAGDGFLADLVADWEADALRARAGGSRVVMVRTGIVQSPRGGALRLLRPLFQLGLGGRFGDGRAWMSWIGIDDLLDIYLRALIDEDLDGPINAVAPEAVRNAEYTQVLARTLGRPALVTVPAFGPRLLLGREGAAEVAMASQRVVPAKLSAAGHTFRQAALGEALAHVLGRARSA